MWKPANSLEWQKSGLCADPANKDKVPLFFSSIESEKNEAKNLCHACPVRSQCLQWALEDRQIYGVWGGRDDTELRRALSVSFTGEEARRKRPPHCPNCTAWPQHLSVSSEHLPNGGRWKTAKVVTCGKCGFAWRSRTSANAVEAHHADAAERARKRQLAKDEKAKARSGSSG
jgi:WhiB family transcriptional regulator, redox-sensing transcriptional regulator